MSVKYESLPLNTLLVYTEKYENLLNTLLVLTSRHSIKRQTFDRLVQSMNFTS